jgi:hypothetical protein
VRQKKQQKARQEEKLPVWHSLTLSGHFRVWVTVWVNENPQK